MAPASGPVPAISGQTAAAPAAGSIDRRHLVVLAAAAAAVAERSVRLRRVAVLAATAAATIAQPKGVRGRPVVRIGGEGPDPWVTRGRVSLMTSHSPHLH